MSEKTSDVSAMADRFLECRVFRHAWTHDSDSNIVTDSRGAVIAFERAVVCLRCTSRRNEVVDARTFDLARSSYDYADGYQYRGVEGGRLPVTEVRREQFRRAGLLRNTETHQAA